MHSPGEITSLLNAWTIGDPTALDRLIPIAYHELHRLAHRYMAHEQGADTLQTTALINEAYLRLVDINHMTFESRAHFYAVCARIMRRILIDLARSRGRHKRDKGVPVTADDLVLADVGKGRQLVAVDEAVNELAQSDPRKAQVIEMRFFGGMTVGETATVLKVSVDTVHPGLALARTWLFRELNGGSMLPDRWPEIDNLYHAARLQAPENRAAFLAEACSGDELLYREIASLLAWDEPAANSWRFPLRKWWRL
jgi:RNA polymerase sigma-70 factor, ECF subfamily